MNHTIRRTRLSPDYTHGTLQNHRRESNPILTGFVWCQKRGCQIIKTENRHYSLRETEENANFNVHKMLQQIYGQRVGVSSRTQVTAGKDGRGDVTSEATLDPETSKTDTNSGNVVEMVTHYR
jgi:hypothetical protein